MIAYRNEDGELMVRNVEWSENYHVIATSTKPTRYIGWIRRSYAIAKINSLAWDKVNLLDTPYVWPHLLKSVRSELYKQLLKRGKNEETVAFLKEKGVSEVNILFVLGEPWGDNPRDAWQYLKKRGRTW